MRCEEIMTKGVATLRREATVQEAARLMAEKDVGFVPVVDNSGAVVGVLTDRDIVVRVVAKGSDVKTSKLADVYSRDLVCCGGPAAKNKVLPTATRSSGCITPCRFSGSYLNRYCTGSRLNSRLSDSMNACGERAPPPSPPG